MTRAVLRIANRVVKSVGILRPFNFVFPKKVGGRWFRIPVLGGVGIGHVQQYEKWMIELLALLIPLREGTFVDIGANLGQTLLKLKSVSPDARYLGLEPNPVCVNYLRSLIRSNDWDDVQVLPVGISNVNRLAELEFYYDNDTAPGASVISGFRPGRRVHHRQYVTLCTFEDVERTANVGTTAVIKIDVEGSEPAVLQGARRTLETRAPLLIIEFNNDGAFRPLLESFGYAFFRFDASRRRLLPLEATEPNPLNLIALSDRSRPALRKRLGLA